MKTLESKLTPTRIIAFGYLAIILLGTILLCLPAATRDNVFTPFSESLFTATSATCVTGLIVHDTYSYWSTFGQAVILCLIQIGGLGFMTFAIYLMSLTKKKIGIVERNTIKESLGATQIGGIVRMAKFIVSWALAIEAAGVLLLSLVYCPRFGFAHGIYFAVFHAVSAFCNAGFDLSGISAQYSSLVAYGTDVFLNVVIMLLIIVGGLGFFVWNDVKENRLHFKKYKLHSKIVLFTSAALIIVGALLIFIFGQGSEAFENLDVGGQTLASFFQSVSARTAGFNTINLAGLTDSALAVMMILMLIGGSPGSTAGGMKTTTFAVLFLTIRSEFRRKKSLECYGRRLPDGAGRRALTLCVIYAACSLVAGIVISDIEGISLMNALFETISAVGTVGLTLGVTPSLGVVSHMILAALMFLGRVGGLTILLALASPLPDVQSQYPQEKVMLG